MVVEPAGREEVPAVVPALASQTLGVHVGGREDSIAGWADAVIFERMISIGDRSIGDSTRAIDGIKSVGIAARRVDRSIIYSCGRSFEAGHIAAGGVQPGVGGQAEKIVQVAAVECVVEPADARTGVVEASRAIGVEIIAPKSIVSFEAGIASEAIAAEIVETAAAISATEAIGACAAVAAEAIGAITAGATEAVATKIATAEAISAKSTASKATTAEITAMKTTTKSASAKTAAAVKAATAAAETAGLGAVRSRRESN